MNNLVQTITPTPDPQELLLLHQIQHHAISNGQAFLLFIFFSLPIPLSWRVHIYYFFSKLPLPYLSPAQFTLAILLWSFLTMILLVISYFFVLWLIRSGIPSFLQLFLKQNTQKIYLQLTFPHDTSKSSYATEQLYKLLHTVSRMQGGFFKPRKTFSLEVVSTRDQGIRYVIGVPTRDMDVIRRSLLSYLPGITVKEIPDYLTNIHFADQSLTTSQIDEKMRAEKSIGVLEFRLSQDFVLPLRDQKKLGVHDSIAFLVGNMTKPKEGEIISYQIVLSPKLSPKTQKRMQLVKNVIYRGLPLSPVVNKNNIFSGILPSPLLFILSPLVWVVLALLRLLINLPSLVLDPNGPQAKEYFNSSPKVPLQILLNPYEQELTSVIKGKLSEQLFETSIRCFILTSEEATFHSRQTGLISSFGQFASEYQSLTTKHMTSLPFFSERSFRKRLADMFLRRLSQNTTILSTSELSDLYHFPNMDLTKIEGLAKSKSQQLPSPLSLKRNQEDIDVLVGKNIYGGEETDIGLRIQDRRAHTYIIGKTGMGKSTIIEGMALQDIQNQKGICVIDPHGDMVEHLLTLIPKSRQKDVIYLNPFDKEYPVGLNILNPGAQFTDIEEEHRRISGIVMSIFMKITPEKYWGQRMEHILRNATLTALQIPTGTSETPYISLYTIQKLLTDAAYRKSVSGQLKDPILKQFWEKEYALFTKNKQGDIISPLTNKIGEFITDPLSRYILLQEQSTINIAEIMDQGKILLVNLSKGNLGEERSAFFGTVITSLIQLATYARSQIPEKKRRDFFVYVDEFQNFATEHFSELFSESRKYHVFFTPSHQNLAQIDDVKVAKIIKGNSGNIIALKGSSDDEKVLLPIFSPEVAEGQIVNLAPHHFFMKVTNEESEDAFSGVTIPIDLEGSDEIKERIIAFSRRTFTTPKDVVKEQFALLLKTKLVLKKSEGAKTKQAVSNGIHHTVHMTKQQLV